MTTFGERYERLDSGVTLLTGDVSGNREVLGGSARGAGALADICTCDPDFDPEIVADLTCPIHGLTAFLMTNLAPRDEQLLAERLPLAELPPPAGCTCGWPLFNGDPKSRHHTRECAIRAGRSS